METSIEVEAGRSLGKTVPRLVIGLLKRTGLPRLATRSFEVLVSPALTRWRLQRLPADRPLKIVIGAGGLRLPGWISTSETVLNLLKAEDWDHQFSARRIDAILAEHVWEHLTPEEGLRAARICFEHMAPGGHLRIAVPDGCHPDPAYIEKVRVGGTGPAADDHKVLFTHRSLTALLEDVGFDVRLLEYYDDAGTFHAADWSPEDGMVFRSARFDARNRGGRLLYTSIIVDAVKPDADV
ncbi:class I SAM-dependent methyltransferase [Rhodobium gokarnense]|uniref:SAM-dependent methyltransferase n=1 Tax=Rhodobium gokarnense TaxID=364296 RepID=A0ABT3HHS7_9HYPH|nr:methyltransferase domain-containing protein [Rhodobium gokarnense]MCW2309960.1 putative SAM-dependent methyltransferase [Rhodobium gokarnense]